MPFIGTERLLIRPKTNIRDWRSTEEEEEESYKGQEPHMWGRSDSSVPLKDTSSHLKELFPSSLLFCLIKNFQMDFRLWISVISATFSWIFCSVLCAPAAETSALSPQRHVRNKRCSCANFLDKECVYFCHLDIIWVNTPERVVSYGLGYAPRAKRAVLDSPGTSGGPRCRCVRENDRSCTNFCLRLELVADARMRSTLGGKHAHRGDTGATERTETVNNNQVWPRALQAALRTRTLLEKWAMRRHHRVRLWQGESTAS